MRTILFLMAVVAVWTAMMHARAQVAPPPQENSDSVTFTDDGTDCSFHIYGSARGLEIIRSRHECVVNVSDKDEPA